MLRVLTITTLGGLLHLYPASGYSVPFVPIEATLVEAEIVVVGEYLSDEIGQSERPPGRDPFSSLRHRRSKKHSGRVLVHDTLKGPVLDEVPVTTGYSDDSARPWIWLIKRNRQNGELNTTGALAVERLDWVRETLENQRTRPWSEAVSGLQASLVVGQDNGGHYLLHQLRNASLRSIHIVRDHRLSQRAVTMTPSDGPVRRLNLSPPRHAPRGVRPIRSEYTALAPGETWSELISLGPVEDGKRYRINATYRNDWDGREFGLDNVWTGELTATAQVRSLDGVVEYGSGIEILRSKPAAREPSSSES